VVTFTLRHELQMAPARYWALFFDRDFNAGLYRFLGFPEWQVLEQKEDGSSISRVVRAVPKMDIPAAVQKVLGPSFAYTEDGRFDRGTQTYRFAMRPSTLEGKLRNEAVMACEPQAQERCVRVVTVTAEAKVFGIGGLLESVIEKNHRATWGKSVEFYDRWAREHPEPAAQRSVG
jgi:hypothetical protein